MSRLVEWPRARWLAPGVILAALVVPAAGLGLPTVTLALVAALVALTPVADDLATRAMAGSVLLLCLGTLCSQLPLTAPSQALAIIVAVLLCVHAVAVVRCPQRRALPRIAAADVIVLLGSLAYAAMIAVPYLGGSREDVLLDLARGYDNLNHMSMVANLMRHGAAPWPTGDGSQAAFEGYPVGVHQLIAALAGADGPTPGEIVVRYAGAGVALAALAPGLAGWIGVRVSSTLRPSRHRIPPAVATAAGFVIMLLVGGDYSSTFVLGHTMFVLPAVIGSAASWLALGLLAKEPHPARHEAWPALGALGVLAVAAAGLMGVYPPLIAGLAPAGVMALLRLMSGLPRTTRIALITALCVVAAGALLVLFGANLEFMLSAVGENGRHLVLSGLSLGLTIILWALFAVRDQAPSVLRAMWPVLGYAGCSMLLAIGAALAGGPVLDNYYATKMLEGAWIVALPIALALVEALARRSCASRGPLVVGIIRAGALAFICGFLLILPVGRQSSPAPGLAQLERRLLEADRSRGRSMIIQDAVAAGPEGSVATVVPEPNGWFYPVDHEDWMKPAQTAAQWVMALRGVRTLDAEPVADCMIKHGDATALPCVQEWVDASPARRLTVVIEPGVASAEQWRELGEQGSTQVRIVETADEQ